MTETPKTAALIEFSHSHYECLYSQLQFLAKSGYIVHLIVPRDARGEVERFGHAGPIEYLDPGTGTGGRWKCVAAVRRYLLHHKIRTVLFNTAEGNYLRDFCLIAPASIQYSGTVHHTNKLHKSFTQKIISLRVKKYFVLNDYLLAGIPRRFRDRVRSFYPIFFPASSNETVQKHPDDIWVAVPGIVEFRRRDYRTLLSQLRSDFSHRQMKFILLGKCSVDSGDGVGVREIIRREGWEDNFMLFSGYVDHDHYSALLRHCDLILPLIHPETALYENYGLWQISGAYNLSFGYGIPMLVHQAFTGVEDFHTAGFFYETEHMMEVLSGLAGDRKKISAKGNEIRSARKFSFNEQRDRFVRFLEGTESVGNE